MINRDENASTWDKEYVSILKKHNGKSLFDIRKNNNGYFETESNQAFTLMPFCNSLSKSIRACTDRSSSFTVSYLSLGLVAKTMIWELWERRPKADRLRCSNRATSAHALMQTRRLVTGPAVF